VVLVTSGPGATNAVTGIVDALMDSIPLVVITARCHPPDRHRRLPGVRHGGHHPLVHQAQLSVKDVADLPHVLHEAFRIATRGRPGPVVVDIPKDVQFASGLYVPPAKARAGHNYQPASRATPRGSPRPWP